MICLPENTAYRWYGKRKPRGREGLACRLSEPPDRLYKYSEAQDVRDAVDCACAE